jgi:hypothetical protein
MAELKPCPICGAKAFLSNDVVDGFAFGWSIGCPRYRRYDGIHGIESYEDHIEKGYAIHGRYTKEQAIEAWNKRVEIDPVKLVEIDPVRREEDGK